MTRAPAAAPGGSVVKRRAPKTRAAGDVKLRIDDLARVANTTTRNIRAYQAKGVLHPPELEGRTGWYGQSHLDRLRAIAGLLDRGYSLGSIAELLRAHDEGAALGAVLGLEAAVSAPFEADAPMDVDLAELAQQFGAHDPALLGAALDAGFLEAREGGVRVASVNLLRAGRDLVQAGIPPRALLEELARLRAEIDPIAAHLVELVVKHVFDPHGKGLPPLDTIPKLTDTVVRVRPLASAVVQTVLARALDRHVRLRIEQRKRSSARKKSRG